MEQENGSIGVGVTLAYSVLAGSTTASDSEGTSAFVALISIAYAALYLILQTVRKLKKVW